MKRSPHLRPLSWAHHDHLIAVFRLRRGLKRGAPPGVMRDYLLDVWEGLSAHFALEERCLGDLVEGHRLLSRMRADHDALRALTARLSAEAEPSTALIERIVDQIERHVRFEERQLFPALEQGADPEALERVGEALSDSHAPLCGRWSHKFWEE